MTLLLIKVHKKKAGEIKKVLDIFLKLLYSNLDTYKQKAPYYSFFTTSSTARPKKILGYYAKITALGEDCVSVRCTANRHRTGGNFTGKHAPDNDRGRFIPNLKCGG